MPHISVKMYTGRTEEQKQKMAEAIKASVMDAINCPGDYISVAIEEYAPEDWNPVFDKEIRNNPNLVIKPNYEPQ
jgi:4-oxalocrotonate tautomerase